VRIAPGFQAATLCLALAATLALAASGCGGEATIATPAQAAASPATCTYRAGWQRLADRIEAAVYCPNWLPDPLLGQIGGRWNNINSVDPDRSYLISFVWQETGPGAAAGELHVNFRGYPGVTKVPTCEDTILGSGNKVRRVAIPCFSDPRLPRTVAGLRVTEYTVNQGADQWHVLYAWKHRGSLYTASEHVAPPVDVAKAERYLDRILRNLVLVEPRGG
jgi:hypothetical protein